MEKTESENRIVELEQYIGWLKMVFKEKMCLLEDIHARLRVLENQKIAIRILEADIEKIGNHLSFVEGEIKSLVTVCDDTLKRQIRLGVRVEVLEEASEKLVERVSNIESNLLMLEAPKAPIEPKSLTDELFPPEVLEEPEEYSVREEALAGIATETVFDGGEV